MSITFRSGDMFEAQVDALVNTVNCVGVMGKGIALEFKRRWPENFAAYKALCEAGTLTPGNMFVFEIPNTLHIDGPKYIVNFPTKKHWRSKSKIEYIETGLDALVGAIERHGITSLALPPLGCGNGGLAWNDVRSLIQSKLANIDGIDIDLFAPKPQMTFERAMLLKTLEMLALHFDGAIDRTSMQKLTYFLQELGIGYGLQFSKNRYGPYSETLRNAFVSMEEAGLIHGFSGEERRTSVTEFGAGAASQYLDTLKPNDADTIIERLDRLIEGYESPFGLELLASVHWLIRKENATDTASIIAALADWNDEKRSKFEPGAIAAAHERLTIDCLSDDTSALQSSDQSQIRPVVI